MKIKTNGNTAKLGKVAASSPNRTVVGTTRTYTHAHQAPDSVSVALHPKSPFFPLEPPGLNLAATFPLPSRSPYRRRNECRSNHRNLAPHRPNNNVSSSSSSGGGSRLDPGVSQIASLCISRALDYRCVSLAADSDIDRAPRSCSSSSCSLVTAQLVHAHRQFQH